jgi:hypothetical protein
MAETHYAVSATAAAGSEPRLVVPVRQMPTPAAQRHVVTTVLRRLTGFSAGKRT